MIRPSKKSLLCVIGLCLGVLFNCDAPRDNPFDPDSPNYRKPYRTRIFVRSLYPPNAAIPGALVVSPNLGLSGVTNAEGFADWQHDQIDSIIVQTFCEGYFESKTVFYPVEFDNEFTALINAHPVLDEALFISIFDNFQNQTYVDMDAFISDRDGQSDIGTVELRLSHTHFQKTMRFEGITLYSVNFNIKELPGNINPQTLPELEFSLFVQNINGDSLVFEPFRIIRVIEKRLNLLEPNLNSRTRGTILFRWEKVLLNYSFTYQILLYRLSGSVELLETFSNIPADSSQFLLDDPVILGRLSNGGHFWLLQVRDLLGNICQSEILTFDYARE